MNFSASTKGRDRKVIRRQKKLAAALWTAGDLNGSGRFDTYSLFPNAVAVCGWGGGYGN